MVCYVSGMSVELSHVVKRYGGKWVGLKDDQRTVVAAGRTVGAVLKRARERGYDDPILYKVPKKPRPYVG